MKFAEATPARLAAGLALGLLLLVAAGQFYLGRSVQTFGDAAAARTALVSVGALSEAIESSGLESPELPTAVERYDSANDAVESIRVIHLKQRRLVASTAPEDAGDRAAPRRLKRDEKPYFDLGQSLRANVESNEQEGRKWKEEISIETAADRRAEQEADDDAGGETVDAGPSEVAAGGDPAEIDTSLYLAAPLEADGEIVGTVLLRARPEGAAIPAAGFGPGALLLCLLPAALLLLISRFVTHRAMLAAIAGVLFVAAVVVYVGSARSTLLDGRQAVETVMSERLGGEAERVAEALGLDASETWQWDMDLFRQPLGLQTETGIDGAKLQGELASQTDALSKLLGFSGLVALWIAAFVGLGGAHRTAHTLYTYREAYAYVLPAMFGMLLLVFLPFLYGVTLAFTNQSIYTSDQSIAETWVGLENFVEILTDFEIVRETDQGRQVNYGNFYWTLGFTIVWTVVNVGVGVSLGLMLAIILNTKGLHIRGVYRVLLILPWAMPNYITALIWKGMFHSQFGVINQMVQMFGGSAVSWFDTPFTSFITVLSTNGWLSFPFMMVICLGALQSIPSDLYEAARVDGASRWQQFRSITLPSLKPALVPAVILSVVWTFNMFNIIYLVSEGEPGGSTEILITEAYKIAFEQYRYGFAAAYSMLIFVILLIYGIWQNRASKATEGV
ncbi:MAG: ABC transporter permease subunit [Actinomycetota bacterium]